ncbi:MAG: hypothetical protein ACI9KN_002148 [Gammaproteobacteria bacterium]|jgi:hypothetical protein
MVLTGAVSASDQADTLLTTISQQLQQGKIVVIYQMRNDDKSSEQYADWASYLNDFATAHAADYRFHAVNKALNEKLASCGIEVSATSYSLFLKQASPGYFYEDVIVEPMVYMAVDQAYGGLLTDEFSAFLPDEVSVEFELADCRVTN